MSSVNDFDDRSVSRIVAAVLRSEAMQRGIKAKVRQAVGLQGESQVIRRGKTTTSAEFPAYPASGCQFVVQWEDHIYPRAVAECDPLTANAHPENFVVARTMDGAHLPENTQVTIVKVQTHEAPKWWILPQGSEGITIEPLKLKDPTWLLPGKDNKLAVQMVWNPATERWEEEPGYLPGDPDHHERLYDDFFRNCVGPEEIVWAKKRPFDPTTNPNNNKWDIIGSQGLLRRGKTESETDCGAKGTFTIYRDVPVDYMPTEGCNGGGDLAGVEFCNVWGYRRMIESGEELTFEYDLGQRKWYPIRDPRPTTIHGTAAGAFCQELPVGINNPVYNDWAKPDCTFDAPVSLVQNYIEHAGEAGAILEAKWDESAKQWRLVNSIKYLQDVVEEVSSDAQGTCPSLDRARQKIVTLKATSCPTASSGPFFNFVQTTLVEDIRQNPTDPCVYEFRTRLACVGSAGTVGNYQPLIQGQLVNVVDGVALSGGADTGNCSQDFSRVQFCAMGNVTVGTGVSVAFTTQQVVTDVEDRSDGLYEKKKNISVPCVGAETEEQTVPYTDCPEEGESNP